MKVLDAWLQNHIKEKLPDAEKLSDLFTFHAFEVEGIEKAGPATVLDLKTLPDRNHYALSHQGIAREIAAIVGLTLKHNEYPEIAATLEKDLTINVEEPTLVRRYMGRRIENVTIKQSPDWFGLPLVAIGARMINSVVDATNVVMFDIGQPMHAFDADKVVGDITVRKAYPEEHITTLDDKEVKLEDWMLVIADDEGPLAIAGVKGGKRAAVTEATKNLIIESANFEPTQVRKTSTKVGIRNDSSKRFENEISPKLAEEGMQQFSSIIKEFSPDAVFGDIVDFYPEPVTPWQVSVTPQYISSVLGVDVPLHEMETILRRMSINVHQLDDSLVLDIPYWRLDLKIPQDIAEEVGRIYGYDKVAPVLPPQLENQTINKVFYWSEKIKDMLIEMGYSEVYTYALRAEGDVEIQNPLASDKGFLRNNLRYGIEQALAYNSRNAALLGLEDIKIFEIGNIFTNDAEQNEHLSLSIGYFTTKSMKQKEKKSLELVEGVIKALNEKLGVEMQGLIESTEAGVIFETDLTTLIEKLLDPTEDDISIPTTTTIYKPISIYPFSSRDIAVFVPEGVSEQDLLDVIVKESGSLLVRHGLFDVFKKQFPDGTSKTSYAFRLVFQSYERTLTDDEINDIMNRITEKMNSQEGWQVR